MPPGVYWKPEIEGRQPYSHFMFRPIPVELFCRIMVPSIKLHSFFRNKFLEGSKSLKKLTK